MEKSEALDQKVQIQCEKGQFGLFQYWKNPKLWIKKSTSNFKKDSQGFSNIGKVMVWVPSDPHSTLPNCG